MHTLLEEAEQKWRREVARALPLWSTMPVIKEAKKEQGKRWKFSTDLQRIYAQIFQDEELQKKFEDVVSQFWDGNPEDIARDTLHYLLYHELYHPLEAPSSKEDNTKIHQAIRRGLLKAEPRLSPLEQVLKVSASQNAVKDFILDNRFAVDNTAAHYVRDDIIPVWDLLELEETPAKTNFYTVTRYLYGLLYGPEKAGAYFSEKTGKKGVALAYEALDALVKKEKPDPLVEKVSAFLFGKKISSEEKQQKREEIRAVFACNERYDGIERFMAVLGKYVEKGMPSGRSDIAGEGSGASSQDILQDLLADMTPEEQNAFLNSVIQESGASGSAQTPDVSSLNLYAMHEFYKKNHPDVRVISGNKKGETVVVGTKEKFVLKNTMTITEDRLSRLSLPAIARFQQRTGLPVLVPLEKGLYRLNEYDIKRTEVRDIVYVDDRVSVPERVEFYFDSSGSMYDGRSRAILGFNDGSRFDMLSSVAYGYIDGLYQAAMQQGKDCYIQIHNVGNKQVSSLEISVKDFWEHCPEEVLRVFFKPENGYAVEDLNIQSKNDGKRRVYVIVTDGELVINGRTERESRKMRELAKQPNTDVVLFEIGGRYSLGTALANDRYVHCFSVSDKNKMLEQGIEVLLTK